MVVGKSKQHFFKSLNLLDVIKPADSRDGAFTATKLVCSLGPSSHSVPVLEAMLKAGMVAARIDLTWGGPDFHLKTLEALSIAMMRTKKLCAIMLDTLGREMMVRRPCEIGEDGWPSHPNPIEISAGQTITLTTREDAESTADVFPLTYPHFHSMVQVGDTIYIGRYLVTGSDQASLYLEVTDVRGQDIICEAQNGAVMDGLMTVYHMERSADSLSNLQNNLPLLSEYDKHTIALIGAQFEVDFVNLAYTRTRDDIHEGRMFLDSIGMTNTRVLAKLETRQALLNIRGILASADGIIVSRGHIGLDVAPEKMALVQKQLISHCNLMGKPVLITRVMDSMVTNPRPTRAEATDIANAVLDGVDGILLGAETLRGSYPVDAVSTVAGICRCAEEVFDHQSHHDYLMTAAAEMEAVVQAATQSQGEPLQPGKNQLTYALGQDMDSDELGGSNGVSPVGSSADFTGAKGSTGSYSNLKGLMHSSSLASLQAAYQEVQTFAAYGGAGSRSIATGLSKLGKGSSGVKSQSVKDHLPFLSVLESLASTAVRVAGKVQADLIVVYTATGRTAQLVAKYRPPMPILTLVVPRLVSDGVKWQLEGVSIARSCQLTRGLLPMLATPGPNGDAVLEAAVIQAAAAGLVAPKGHVVVLQQVHNDLCVKVMSLDKSARRIAGPRGAHLRSKVGGLYPKTPAPKVHREKKKKKQDPLHSDEDDTDDDDEDMEGYDEHIAPYLAGMGDLQTSASMLYDDEVAKVLSGVVKQHLGGRSSSLTLSSSPGGAGDAAFRVDVAALKPQHGVIRSSPGQAAK